MKKIIALSASSLDESSSCLRRFYYSRVKQLCPVGQMPDYILKGAYLHHLLEFYYKAKKAGDASSSAMEAGIVAGRSFETPLDINIQEELQKAFTAYVKEYSNEDWIIESVEEPFSRVLFENEDIVILWEGKKDLVVTTNKQRMVVDHKTGQTDSIPSMLKNQFLGYAWAEEVDIICVNRIVLHKRETLFKRYLLSYSQDMKRDWLVSVLYHAGVILQTEAVDVYPQNFASCKGCGFTSLCETNETQREFLIKNDYQEKIPFDLFAKQ